MDTGFWILILHPAQNPVFLFEIRFFSAAWALDLVQNFFNFLPYGFILGGHGQDF